MGFAKVRRSTPCRQCRPRDSQPLCLPAATWDTGRNPLPSRLHNVFLRHLDCPIPLPWAAHDERSSGTHVSDWGISSVPSTPQPVAECWGRGWKLDRR